MYKPDMSVCELATGRRPLLPEEIGKKIIAIGWLDEKHPYSVGDIPEHALDRLFDACFHPVYVTRGFHICPFCKVKSHGVKATRKNRERVLGDAELRIFAEENDIVYAVPNLIYHYVAEHKYSPPQEFVKALLLPAAAEKSDLSHPYTEALAKGINKIFRKQI